MSRTVGKLALCAIVVSTALALVGCGTVLPGTTSGGSNGSVAASNTPDGATVTITGIAPIGLGPSKGELRGLVYALTQTPWQFRQWVVTYTNQDAKVSATVNKNTYVRAEGVVGDSGQSLAASSVQVLPGIEGLPPTTQELATFALSPQATGKPAIVEGPAFAGRPVKPFRLMFTILLPAADPTNISAPPITQYAMGDASTLVIGSNGKTTPLDKADLATLRPKKGTRPTMVSLVIEPRQNGVYVKEIRIP